MSANILPSKVLRWHASAGGQERADGRLLVGASGDAGTGAHGHVATDLKVGGVTPYSNCDYPGQLASVIFVQGCPWRCGYCHNPHLQPRSKASPYPWQEVLALLQRRVGLIDAVVFSGGEALLDPALPQAMAEVRALGFLVGLHSAGIYPQRLREVLPLLDWVGFDVKAGWNEYAAITGIKDSGSAPQESLALLLASGVAYEVRTTIHPALLPEAAILALAQDLARRGVKNYALQVFRAQGCQNAALTADGVAQVDANWPGTAVLEEVKGLFAGGVVRR